MFAAACSDGTIRFYSRSGREEKKIAAHEGAVISIAWSHDGVALLTSGEDGDVKIWSRSGNMRSVLASTGQSVYCACWGPDDDQVVFSSGNALMIKTVQANKKNLKWDAHDGIVLCVDWNITNQNIVSGGEDCVYHVWDSFGRMLYTSKAMENVITAVKWSPQGEVFAVGMHNHIRLCDKTGWTHSKERVHTGSIMSLAWTSDGTQFAGAGGSGCVVFAQIVDRHHEWKNIDVILTEPRKIRVLDAGNETMEDLEYPRDRVVDIAVGFEMLVVATSTQCYVYSINNLNTPIIFDIKAPPHFMHLCRKHFLTVDLISGVQVISFEGRVLCSPRFQGLRADYLNRDMLSLAPDMVCIVDTVDSKVVHILDPLNGRPLGKVTHTCEVCNICLNQHSAGAADRLLAFSDRNRDLFIAHVGVLSTGAFSSSSTPLFSLLIMLFRWRAEQSYPPLQAAGAPRLFPVQR
jgi:intraflagellar transport protein 80